MLDSVTTNYTLALVREDCWRAHDDYARACDQAPSCAHQCCGVAGEPVDCPRHAALGPACQRDLDLDAEFQRVCKRLGVENMTTAYFAGWRSRKVSP